MEARSVESLALLLTCRCLPLFREWTRKGHELLLNALHKLKNELPDFKLLIVARIDTI